jgi:hypothetical protein
LTRSGHNERKHQFGSKQLGEIEIIEVLNSRDESQYFYSDIVSYPCYDSVCEIMNIRIYWDLFGDYLKYELFPPFRLTKKDHVEFTDAEYLKLHEILTDKNSYFKYIRENQLLTQTNENDANQIDAVSTATVSNKNIKAVENAVKTCYSLWQFTHVVFPPILKNIANLKDSISKKMEVKQLFELYKSSITFETKKAVVDELERTKQEFNLIQLKYLLKNNDKFLVYLLSLNFEYDNFKLREREQLKIIDKGGVLSFRAINYFLIHYHKLDYPQELKKYFERLSFKVSNQSTNDL